MRLLLFLTCTLLVLVAACSGSDNATQTVPTAVPATVAPTEAQVVPTAAPEPYDGPVETLEPVVLTQVAHDTGSFTQGLEFDDSGRLFESTGSPGTEVSALHELDPATGAVLRRLDVPGVFGEGLTLVDDRIIQLTWQAGQAYVYQADTFELLETLSYPGQGWGLCHDGTQLVMSDGSSDLTFRNADTFAELGRVTVTMDDIPVLDINELECVNGDVWANLWLTDNIVRINPMTGRVTGVVDASGLLSPHPQETDSGAVLNGIAAMDDGTFLITGKHWPAAFQVRFEPAT